MATELKKELLSILEPVGQAHLLQFWDKLIASEQESLAAEIKSIDWKAVLGWLESAKEGFDKSILKRIIPAPYQPATPAPEQKDFYAKAMEHAADMLRAGKIGAFTVAGGQGTRLGYEHPKGTYPVTPIKSKSLFQVFAEGILYTERKYNTVIPWYIMTSCINDAETRAFFKEHNYFGLDARNVSFFPQAMIPAFDKDTGKALLATPSSLALSPNGHGGSFAAIQSSGALDDMLRRGITTLAYWQVDNPLIREFDRLFIGLHDLTKSDMSCRALIKRDWAEKLGHFCLLDGRHVIIEYSDMSEELCKLTDSDGRLTYRAGSPAIHVLSVDFIRRLTSGALNLPPHRAIKKVPFVQPDGILVKPEAPNAIKLEFFLFDALPLASNPLILEGDRNEEFAPVKNPSGQDSRDSSIAAQNARTADWFERAGFSFPRNADSSPAAEIELSPATFGGPKDIAEKLQGVVIKPGDKRYFE